MRIGQTEELRIGQATGLIKANQLTQTDWELIAEHERILAECPDNP